MLNSDLKGATTPAVLQQRADNRHAFQHRRGRVVISLLLAREEWPTLAAQIFTRFFPSHAEHRWGDHIVYEGVSADFDEIQLGEVLPTYVAELKREADGPPVFLQWRRER